MNTIVAVDENWAIGKDGALLVHLPGDLKYFKDKTMGKVVIMGRTTLETLPNKKPLPGRRNIVLSRNEDYTQEGAEVAHSVEEVEKLVADCDEKDVYVIGGAEIFKRFFDLCDTFFITKIYNKYPADRHFVDLDKERDIEIAWKSEKHTENDTTYQYFEYKRKSNK